MYLTTQFEMDRLHPLVQKMVKLIIKSHPATPISYASLCANFALAQVCAIPQFKIQVSKLHSAIPINMYAMSIMNSGKAKDEPYRICNELIGRAFHEYELKYNEVKDSYNQKLLIQFTGEKGDKKSWLEARAIRPFTPELKITTVEGAEDVATSFYRAKMGYLLNKHSEFLDAYAEQQRGGAGAGMLSFLKDIYYGEYRGKTTKGNRLSEHIKDLPVFVWFHSAPDLFANQNLLDKFKRDMASGMNRRSFFCFPDDDEYGAMKTFNTLEEREADAEEFAKGMAELKHELGREVPFFIKHIDGSPVFELNYGTTDGKVSSNKILGLTQEAKEELHQYMNYIAIEHNANSEDNAYSRNERMLKLAGVYAIWEKAYEQSPIIEARHIEYAIYFTEMMAKYSKKMREYSNACVTEKIFADISRKPMGNIELMKRPYFNNLDYLTTMRANIPLLKEMCSNAGHEFRYENEQYYAPKIAKVSLSQIKLSVSEDITVGFQPITVEFNKLHEILASDVNYSPSMFENGYRKASNFIGGNNVVILDIDDGITWEQAKIHFGRYKCLLSTTRSHQIAKGGKPAVDRFRVVIPLNQEITCSSEEFKNLMANIMEFFACGDPACKDSSRFYYPNALAQHWYSDGIEVLDITQFFKSKEQKTMPMLEYTRTNGTLSESLGTDKVYAIFGMPPAEGSRSNYLWRSAFIMMKDSSVDFDSAVKEVWRLNDAMPSPMPTNEVERNIIKQMERLWV